MGRLVLRRAADLRPRVKALDHIAEIDRLGGMAKAIEAGVPKRRIEEAAARTQARIDAGRQIVVGVNRYRPAGRTAASRCSGSTTRAVRSAQIEKLKRLRAERDPAATEAALTALTEAARSGSGNLLALSIDAARAKATVGEISQALEMSSAASARYRCDFRSLRRGIGTVARAHRERPAGGRELRRQ